MEKETNSGMKSRYRLHEFKAMGARCKDLVEKQVKRGDEKLKTAKYLHPYYQEGKVAKSSWSLTK